MLEKWKLYVYYREVIGEAKKNNYNNKMRMNTLVHDLSYRAHTHMQTYSSTNYISHINVIIYFIFIFNRK